MTKNILTMEVTGIVKKTTETLTEALTGIAKSTPQDLFVSIGYLAQRVIAGQQLSSLQAEFEHLRKKGKLNPKFESSMLGKYTLLELLNFLNDPLLDDERWQLLKKIFMVTACSKDIKTDDPKALLYMKLVKTLNSGEVLLLMSSDRMLKNPPPKEKIDQIGNSGDRWLEFVVESYHSFGTPELVATYEDGLIEKRLFSPRTYSDKSGVSMANMRLTRLGIDLCNYIGTYEGLQD